MYYDKDMKRTILVFCMCLLSMAVGAQSTCETRVDAHPHATTNQRVDYCLNEAYENIYNNPGLVFSGVTTRHPATQQPTQRPTAHEGSFNQDEVTVNQNFVETRQFPKLTDGRVSQQEIWAQRRAVYQGQQMAQEAAEQTACEPQEEIVKTEPATTTVETKAGLKARTRKPGRRFMQVSNEMDDTPYMAEPAPQEVAPLAAEYSYDETATQSYAPATQNAQEYVPATDMSAQEYVPATDTSAQEYVPAEQPVQSYEPYVPAGQEEIPVGTSSYAPAN